MLAVVTDRRLQACENGLNIYYTAQVVSVSDYYPFGMQISERTWEALSDGYRFGYSGYERENDAAGQGAEIDFGARIYDSRLGRILDS